MDVPFGVALRIFTFEEKGMSQLSCGLGRGGKPAAPVTLIGVEQQKKKKWSESGLKWHSI
jgi:hypothetical protein